MFIFSGDVQKKDLAKSSLDHRWSAFHRNFLAQSCTFLMIRKQQLQKKSLRKLLSAIFKQFVNFRFKLLGFFLIIQGLPGCGSHVYHFVEPGETLYSISFLYGHDYREVAQWNDITSPYIVKRGQRLRVVPVARSPKNTRKSSISNVETTSQTPGKARKNHADTESASTSARVESRKAKTQNMVWRWPIKGGKIIRRFDAANPAKQGLDLQGQFGQPVYAAESGRVVYSGSGLKHYGKLIIVKHNETFLSAYAHNKRLLVKEGDVLQSGQRIAEMGSTGTNTTKLHFEIRRNGKPVDPLRYLPRR